MVNTIKLPIHYFIVGGLYMKLLKKAVFLISFFSLAMVTGCTTKKNVKPVTKPTEPFKEYDVATILGKLVIGGKEIGFPFKIEDLPEGYRLTCDEDDYSYEKLEGKTEFSVDFIKDENNRISTTWRCKEKQNIIDDGQLCFVGYTEEEGDTNETFSIDDIGCENTVEDVINKFGEPSETEIIEEMDLVELVYKMDDDNKIVFMAFDRENISQIWMTRSLN